MIFVLSGRRLGCLGLLFAFGCFWGGCQALFTALSNRSPLRISATEFARTRPNKHWLQLTDCELHVEQALYMKDSKPIRKLYVPVRPRGAPRTQPALALYETWRPELISLFNRLESAANVEEVARILDAQKDFLARFSEIRGLIRFGIDLKSGERDELARVSGYLDPRFFILQENSRPELGLGIFLTLAGLGILGFIGYRTLKDQAEKGA
jgi:hypothetical protein